MTNEINTPQWIYKIDLIEPNVIFKNGFKAYGYNRNFFHHILGESLEAGTAKNLASKFISASENIQGALRFLGSFLRIRNIKSFVCYVYKIRADENVYSAGRTAARLYARIKDKTLTITGGLIEQAMAAVDDFNIMFAYEGQWFNNGDIPPERIFSAYKVTAHLIDQSLVPTGETFYLPQIDTQANINPAFKHENTHASDLPFDIEEYEKPISLNLHTTAYKNSITNDLNASMGFSCGADFTEITTEPKVSFFKQCYIDEHLTYEHLGKTFYMPVDPVSSRIVLVGEQTREFFFVFWNKDPKVNALELRPYWFLTPSTDFIYDSYYRIGVPTATNSLFYCFTLKDTSQGYNLAMDIGAINDPRQKFSFQRKTPYNIEAYSLLPFTLTGYDMYHKIKGTDQKIYFLRADQSHPGYEKLYFAVDSQKTYADFLRTQGNNSHLIDLGLSWFYLEHNYVIIPETGYSYAGAAPEKRFFYDLITRKIIYVKTPKNLFCLYNKRDAYYYYWDWVRWIPTTLDNDLNERTKWAFVNRKWGDNIYDLNWRNIKSVYNNDFIRVLVRGSNWGALYTTPYKSGINSIAVFTIFHNSTM